MLIGRLRRVADGDRGAVAALVAIVFASMVLFAMAALAVDTGQFYAEKAQLQNGADAAAVAVAESCAKSSTNTCSAGSVALAGSYGDSNANDNKSAVDYGPCGNGADLPACPAPRPDPNFCPDKATPSGNWVDVQLRTETSNGGRVLPSFFSKAVIGDKYAGTMRACARATWGAPTSCGNCVPLTISLCEWYQDTKDGSSFATAPPAATPKSNTYATTSAPYVSVPSYLDTITARRASSAYNETPTGPNFYADPKNNITDPHNPLLSAANGTSPIPIAGAETVLLAHSAGTTGFGGSDCAGGTDGSNQTAPGQFGWLCKNSAGCGDGPCTADINGSTYGGSPGSPPPNCETIFLNSRNNMTPIYLPVYGSVTGTGSNTQYTLAGFAAFVVTGWGGLNAGKGFPTYTSCDSIITLSDTNPPDASLKWKPKSPTSTGCSDGGSGKNDFADYCGNYTGNNNCNGNADQAVYGYFTKSLIPAAQLPDGSGDGKDLGATSASLIG